MAQVPKLAYWLLVEFIGTLILGVLLNIMKRMEYGTLLMPFAFWIPYMICWKISNAHLNPAVTLVAILRRDYKFGIIEGLLYMVFQFLGFLIAMFLAWWYTRNVSYLKLWKIHKEAPWMYSEGVGMEFTGSLIFILFHSLQLTRNTSLSANTGLNSFVVATFYGALIWWSKSVTGGSFNPAYGAAHTFVDSMDTGEEDSIRFIWVYVVLPFVAALFVWPVVEFIYGPAYKDEHNKQTEVFKAKTL